MTRIATIVFLGMLAAFAAFDVWLWSARVTALTCRKTPREHSPATLRTGPTSGDAGYAHRAVLAGRPRKDLMRVRPTPRKSTPSPATPDALTKVTVRAVLVEAHQGDPVLDAILPGGGSPFSRSIPASRLAAVLEPLEGGSTSKVIAEPRVETLLDAPTRIVLDLGDETTNAAEAAARPAGGKKSPPPIESSTDRRGPAASRIELEFTISRSKAGSLIADLHPRLTGAPCPGTPGARELHTEVALNRDESVLLGGLVWCSPAADGQTSRPRELMMILSPQLEGKKPPSPPTAGH